MRRLLGALVRLATRIFFRRVEVDGLATVPASGPTILVLNHPNGLVDPGLPLGFFPRPLSFLAKEPLFHVPVLGWAMRRLDSIPVYRKKDAADTAKNRATFAAARDLLRRGGVLALFPEGESHDDPRLRPLKTGAARIALGAALDEPIQVVAAGLTYTAKHEFRSEALLVFGPPFPVEPVSCGPDGEPPAAAVEAVTERIQQALDGVTLQADERRALALSAAAEELLRSSGAPEGRGPLAERVALRKLLLARYARLKEEQPARIASLERRLARLSDVLAGAGLTPADLAAGRLAPGRLVAETAVPLGLSLVLLPAAAAGIVTHWPAYRLVGALANRLAKGEVDVVSTMKILSSFVFFPVTWVVLSLAVGETWGLAPGLVALAALPLCGGAALLFVERAERFFAAARAVGLALFRRRGLARLRAEADALRREMLGLEDELSREDARP